MNSNIEPPTVIEKEYQGAIAIIVTSGYMLTVLLVVLLMGTKAILDSTLLDKIAGIFGTAFGLIVGYYFGSRRR